MSHNHLGNGFLYGEGAGFAPMEPTNGAADRAGALVDQLRNLQSLQKEEVPSNLLEQCFKKQIDSLKEMETLLKEMRDIFKEMDPEVLQGGCRIMEDTYFISTAPSIPHSPLNTSELCNDKINEAEDENITYFITKMIERFRLKDKILADKELDFNVNKNLSNLISVLKFVKFDDKMSIDLGKFGSGGASAGIASDHTKTAEMLLHASRCSQDLECEDCPLSVSQIKSILHKMNGVVVPNVAFEFENKEPDGSANVTKLLYIIDSFNGHLKQVDSLSSEKEELQSTIDKQILKLNLRKRKLNIT
ncbi:CAP-Gly domain-containing linker protein 1 [Dorcoceras hygrometricum]|nr:CAP-Gly domain-containing linker protein 1 [Dorcoceras hygrometricum]